MRNCWELWVPHEEINPTREGRGKWRIGERPRGKETFSVAAGGYLPDSPPPERSPVIAGDRQFPRNAGKLDIVAGEV